MAKSASATDELEEQIAQAARAFAREVVAAIGNATVSDLISLESNHLFPPASLDAIAAAQIGKAVKRKRNWPTCSRTDCSHAYYPASGKSHLCYEHFLGSGGRHPSKRR